MFVAGPPKLCTSRTIRLAIQAHSEDRAAAGRRLRGTKRRRRRSAVGDGLPSQPSARRAIFPALPPGPDPVAADHIALDAPILDMAVSIAPGRFAGQVPDRVVPLSAIEIEDIAGPAAAPRPAGVRLGALGLAELADFGPRQRKTIVGYLERWNIFVTKFCDIEHYDPWVFDPLVFELFAGWMYELGKVASIDNWASSFNYVYRVHNLFPAFRDGRIREIKSQFKKAAKARKIERGDVWLRTEIPSRAIRFMLDIYRVHELGAAAHHCERIAAILVLLLFWTRASTFGNSRPGDLALVPGHGSPALAFTLRKVKMGAQRWAPTTMALPIRPPAGNEAARIFQILELTLTRNPRFSGEALGLTFDNAAYQMTDWICEYMPRDEVHLPPGTYIASQSGRITGASHARVSLNAPWTVITAWGGWRSLPRYMGYIREVLVEVFMAHLYWFLNPGHVALAGAGIPPAVHFPRVGYMDGAE